eukprot:20774-Heterococcus_DN1.PRE.2
MTLACYDHQQHSRLNCKHEVVHGGAVQFESMGHGVGYRLTERLCQAKALSGESLEAVKFICKDLWGETFKKQIDKLQTDHRGTFVLRDLNFRWLNRYAPDRRAADKELVTLLLQYPCGLVRGAMSALGHPASVKAEFWDEKTDKSILPTVSFTVKLLPKQQQQQQQQQQP